MMNSPSTEIDTMIQSVVPSTGIQRHDNPRFGLLLSTSLKRGIKTVKLPYGLESVKVLLQKYIAKEQRRFPGASPYGGLCFDARLQLPHSKFSVVPICSDNCHNHQINPWIQHYPVPGPVVFVVYQNVKFDYGGVHRLYNHLPIDHAIIKCIAPIYKLIHEQYLADDPYYFLGMDRNVRSLCRVCSLMCNQGTPMRTCEGCGKSWYCSVKCQRSHWIQHKSHCVGS
jgi:hypothetical protein